MVPLRCVVVRNASVEADLAAYRRYLPDRDFFRDTRTPFPCVDKGLERLERKALDAGLPCVEAPANGARP